MEECKQGQELKPKRDKYWCELDGREKIERMRAVIKRDISNLYEECQELRQIATKALEIASNHRHNNENVTVPVDGSVPTVGRGLLSNVNFSPSSRLAGIEARLNFETKSQKGEIYF